MTWVQIYDPLNNIWLSAFIAAIPIIFFFLALTVLKLQGHVAAFIATLLAVGVALLEYQMPGTKVLASAGFGIGFGLFPVSYIVIGAVFLYKLSVESGQFYDIRRSIIAITKDQRLQMLLIAYSFNAFLEGAAGFGAPIAITAALLVGLGFPPLKAAALCLIANGASGAYGALGIPVLVASKVGEVPLENLNSTLNYQLPYIAFVIPFILVMIMSGFKGLMEVWPGVFVSAFIFAGSQYVTVEFIGPELADITSSLLSLIGLAVFLKFWQPKQIDDRMYREKHPEGYSEESISFADVVYAWSPFYILTATIGIWSIPAFKELFAEGGLLSWTTTNIPIPFLHNEVIKTAPIVADQAPYGAVLSLNWVSATGTAILVAALISIVVSRLGFIKSVRIVKDTIRELTRPILTICFVLAFAFVSNYGGLSSTFGLALAGTGTVFPFFSPMLGWIGVLLTGSVVSNNALFASLQNITANQIGVQPVLLVAANTIGGTMAKMLSPQSIAIAAGAVGLAGKESALFKATLKYSIGLLLLVGLLTFVFSTVF